MKKLILTSSIILLTITSFTSCETNEINQSDEFEILQTEPDDQTNTGQDPDPVLDNGEE